MTKTSTMIASALATVVVVAASGAAFAQSANGGGGGGNGGSSSGGGPTMAPATYLAVVPDNQSQQPRQRYLRVDTGGCLTPMEGRNGRRLVNSCGPE